MKLPDLLPPNDLLKKVEGVESGLHQRQRLGVVGLILAVLQIVVLVVNNEWFQGLTTTNWTQLIKQRWGLLLILIGAVTSLVLAAWSRFWLEESQAPFRYTYSIADFKPVSSDSKEEALSVQLSHDLAQRLNERIKRLSLLDDDQTKKESDADTKRKSHIHIRGFYLIRRNPEGLWFIELMPRVRIGPSGSAETLAHVVRFRLPDDATTTGDGAPGNEAKADENAAPRMTGRQYEQILERVYFSVASEIYKQIQQDVKRKIELLPTDYYRAVALFYEAEDYAASNTLDAYRDALNLYDESLKAFDPSRRRPLQSKFPRFVQKKYQWLNAIWSKLRSLLNSIWPRLGKVELLCARAEIGYASMLYYQRSLASILAQKTNAPFEIRPVAQSARNRLLRVSPDLPGRNDSLFDANVTLSLAWESLGVLTEAKRFLEEALPLNPVRAETDPKFLFAAGCLNPNGGESLQLYQQAVELEPRFDVAQFSRAIGMEMAWRRKSVLERNVAELVFREYEELLRTNPGNVGAWSNTGYMRWLLDDAEKAKEAFEVGREYKEIKRETFVAELDYGLARVAAEAGDFATAYQYFDSGSSALLARGVDHSARGDTAEFYHYDLINKIILDRFERYREKLEANLKFWDDLDEVYGSFQGLIAAVQDPGKCDTAVKVLAELFLLSSKRISSVDRRALADWASKQANTCLKAGLKTGDLAALAEQLKTSVASTGDPQAYADLRHSLEDRPFINLIDRHTPKRRVRDAVHAFVLEDYGNACFRYFSRTGDNSYYDKAKEAYQNATKLNDEFVLPHYRLYTKIEKNDKHIAKVTALAEYWPDGKLERSKNDIEKLWNERETAEAKAKEHQDLAAAASLRATSLSAKASEARDNARQKRSDAADASADFPKTPTTERGPDGNRVPDVAVAHFNKQLDVRIKRQPGAAEVSENQDSQGETIATGDLSAPPGSNVATTPVESRREILIREAEELEQAAKNYEAEDLAARIEVEEHTTKAKLLLESAMRMEIPEDTVSSEYLKDFLPHKWLWIFDSKGKKYTFNLKALDNKDYAADHKWEREFNSLQVTALLLWAQSRKIDEAVRLFDHLRDHFWPEDFELLRARRRLLKDRDKDKAENEAKLRTQVKGWLQDSPHSVITYWIGEIFGDQKAETYVEALGQDGFSQQCYQYLGDALVNLNRNDDALKAFKRCRTSEGAAYQALGQALEVRQQPQAAVDAYLQASRSDDPQLLLELGNKLHDLGKTKDAIQIYRKAMNTCDAPVLRRIGQELEKRELWLDSLGAYRRAKASDKEPVTAVASNYHLLLGRNLLALARPNADVEFKAMGQMTGLSGTAWRSAIVQNSLDQVTSIESYRLLRAWLEAERTECQRCGDVAGRRDATEAILLLTREKYFSLNPNRAALPSLRWSCDIVDLAIDVDAEVFATGSSQDTSRLTEQLDEVRQRIEQEMGVPTPYVRIRPISDDYAKNSYIVIIGDVPTVMGTVQPGQTFFPLYKEQFPEAELGTPAFNPQTGEMDGAWLDQTLMGTLQASPEKGWNQFEYAAQHVEANLRANLSSFLSPEQVLTRVASWQTNDCENEGGWRNKLVESALPDNSSRLRFTQVLQALVRENVSTIDLQAILEGFSKSRELDLISSVEEIRLAIKDQLPGNTSSFQFLCLSKEFEEAMSPWIWNQSGKVFLAIGPEDTQGLLNAVRVAVGDRQHSSLVVVSHAPGIRPFVRRLIELEFPRIRVLSFGELRRDLLDQLSETIEYVK
jgi:hypothetical protein